MKVLKCKTLVCLLVEKDTGVIITTNQQTQK